MIWETQGQNDLLKEYLWKEWQYNVHKRYWKYFEEWYDNLLDSQKYFFKSWMKPISLFCRESTAKSRNSQ